MFQISSDEIDLKIEVDLSEEMFGNLKIPDVRADENAAFLFGQQFQKDLDAIELIGETIAHAGRNRNLVEYRLPESKITFVDAAFGPEPRIAEPFVEIIKNRAVAPVQEKE